MPSAPLRREFIALKLVVRSGVFRQTIGTNSFEGTTAVGRSMAVEE